MSLSDVAALIAAKVNDLEALVGTNPEASGALAYMSGVAAKLGAPDDRYSGSLQRYYDKGFADSRAALLKLSEHWLWNASRLENRVYGCLKENEPAPVTVSDLWKNCWGYNYMPSPGQSDYDCVMGSVRAVICRLNKKLEMSGSLERVSPVARSASYTGETSYFISTYSSIPSDGRFLQRRLHDYFGERRGVDCHIEDIWSSVWRKKVPKTVYGKAAMNRTVSAAVSQLRENIRKEETIKRRRGGIYVLL